MGVTLGIIEPDSFQGKPLAWAGNQCGHMVIGLFTVFYACMACYVVTGELPMRSALFWVILAGYLLFEIVTQGWRGADTVEDTVFVAAYGAGGTLSGFKEVSPGDLDIIFNMAQAAPVFFAATAHLAFGMAFRLISAYYPRK